MPLARENDEWVLVNNGAPERLQWVEKYRANFATVSAHNFKTGGDTLAINGVTWTQVNNGNASVLGFDGSTGLVINPANGSNLYSGGDTAPRIVAQFNDLCGGDWDPNSQTVAVVCRMTSSLQIAAQFDAYGVVMTKDTGSLGSANNLFLYSGPLFVDSARKYTVSDGSEYKVAFSGIDATAVEHIIYPGGLCRTKGGTFPWSGTPSTVVPTPEVSTNWDAIHAEAVWNQTNNRITDSPGRWDSTITMNRDRWAVGPYAFEVSSGTGIAATFSEFMVYRLE